MTEVTVMLPDSALRSTTENPQGFIDEVLLAAAVKWYELGRISQSKAAEIAGVSRHEFLEALNTMGVSPFQESGDDLRRGQSLE